MSIKFATLVRLPGKICQKVVIDSSFDEIGVANKAGQKEAPYTFFPLPDEPNAFLLVLPVLDIDQTCGITLKNANGAVIDKAKKTFSPKLTALESKKNSTLNKEEANHLRQACDAHINDSTNVRLSFAFFNPVAQERTLRIDIEAILSEASNKKAHFDIKVLDSCLNPIECRRTAVLTEEFKPIEFTKDALRYITYSATVDANVPSCILWVKFDDVNTVDNFLCLLPYMLDGIKADSDRFLVDDSGIGPAYHDWFIQNHRATKRELDTQKSHDFKINPLYSIIVPLYKTPAEYFKDMIESVFAQTYQNFELILVNASPEDESLRKLVAAYAKKDSRIVVVNLGSNYGITLNTNEGIKVAKGDFVSFFDHDDILEPNLLFEYTKGVNLYPETDLLYCDEDKYADGRYFECNLKPDFDWDLIKGCNYVCHLLTVRKSIVDSFEQLPGKQYDGSQDHNLTLKVAEKARNIYHARKVLYHWRFHPGSTAADAGSKPWTQDSGRIAIQEHLDRIGIEAEVVDHYEIPNFYEVNYKLPHDKEKVSIIIPTRDNVSYLRTCLESIEQLTTYENYEIILVENNSKEQETFDYYNACTKDYTNVHVVKYPKTAFNYSAICNYGAREAAGHYLLFLNNDTKVITPNWLEYLVGHLQREKVGCVGAKLYYPDDTTQHVGIVIPKGAPLHSDLFLPKDAPGYFVFTKLAREALAVTGACQGIRKDLFDSFNGFDETLPTSYNDVDLCLRLYEAGYLNVIEPRATLYHYESVSRGLDALDAKKRVRLAADLAELTKRHPKYFIEGDPYYNPNFKANACHHELGW